MRDAFFAATDPESAVAIADDDLTILVMKRDQNDERRTAQDKPALSPDDIATELDVSVASVYRWISAGYIKAIRVGPKLFRIRREDYNAFIAAGGVPPKGAKEGDKDK